MAAWHKIANAFTQVTTAIFIVEIVAAHSIYRDLNVYATPLSVYAVGPYWWLVTSGLVFTAANYLLLTRLFLSAEKERSFSLALGSGLLAIVGLMALAVAIFPTDISPAETARGTIHVIAAHLHFILLPLAAILSGCGVRTRALLVYKKITFTFSGSTIVLGSLVVIDAEVVTAINISGLLQKILILIILAWIMFTSASLSRVLSRRSA